MKLRIKPEHVFTALQLSNLFLAIATSLAVIRFGQTTLGLPVSLGLLLVLGWGANGLQMLNPSLGLNLWSVDHRTAERSSAIQLCLFAVILVSAYNVPVITAWLADLCKLSPPLMLAFTGIGAFRAFTSQSLTLSLRLGKHRMSLSVQLAARLIEIASVATGCIIGDIVIVAVGFLIFPLAQVAVYTIERRQYREMASTPPAKGKSSLAVSAAQRVLDTALPTIWFNFVSHEIYLAYRAISASMANTMLVPRYWYIMTKGRGSVLLVSCAVAVAAALGVVAFLFISRVTDLPIYLWAVLVACATAPAAVVISRWKQNSLLKGEVLAVSLATIAATAVEAVMVVLLHDIGNGVLLATASIVFPVVYIAANRGYVMRYIRIVFFSFVAVFVEVSFRIKSAWEALFSRRREDFPMD